MPAVRLYAMGAGLGHLGHLGLLCLTGCAGPALVDRYPNQQAMIGTSRAALLSCAGLPTRQQVRNDVTLLQYYREAPILEESSPTGKSSFATIRHGCWATVVVADERVTEVRYRFAPPTSDASNDCEAIFDACLP